MLGTGIVVYDSEFDRMFDQITWEHPIATTIILIALVVMVILMHRRS